MIERKKQLIIENYPRGFSFEPTSLVLVKGKIGEELDAIDLAEMKQEMFQQQDGVWLFIEQVADEETRRTMINTAEKWINEFGCFALEALQSFAAPSLKDGLTIEDFGTLLDKLHYPSEAYQSSWYNQHKNKIRWTRPVGTKADSALQKLAGCIANVITEKYSATDYEIIEAIPALNRELLLAVVKDKLSHVIKTENNGTTVFQFAENHLPEDLRQKINDAIEKLEKCGLPLTQENLHCTLSLLYKTNFNETYQLPDMKCFRQMIEKRHQNENYYWKNNGKDNVYQNRTDN